MLSKLAHLISVAKGELPADLVLANARVVNVFTGEIEPGNVAIYSGRIAGVGDYHQAKQVLDLEGKYLAPGLIAGLLSDEPLEVVIEKLNRLEQVAAHLGTTLPSPFSTLSFLALPVIPELRLTGLGLVDVGEFRLIK
ncbi:adenine deaminase C-terminal domain-containing protein [Chloroflexota bacterium]